MHVTMRSIVLIVLLSKTSECSPRLFKRVINGETFEGRPSTFSAIRYYAVIGTSHSTWYTFGYPFAWFNHWGLYGIVHCSGALVTPIVYQTACHCVASFSGVMNTFLKAPVVDHHWEGRMVVYAGVSNRFGDHSMVTTHYVLTEKFLVHSKCGGLCWAVDRVTSSTYDYALVVLDDEWLFAKDSFYEQTEIAYAPQYPEQDIERFHTYALRSYLVCLLMGFGDHIEGDFYGSDHLRHGWAILMSRKACKGNTGGIVFGDFIIPVTDDQFSWDCTREFPQHNSYPGIRDSGGPLTCNDRYFAVVSGSKWHERRKKRYNVVGKHHPLLNNLFPNAIEYRNYLLFSIFHLAENWLDAARMTTHRGSGFIHFSERQANSFAITNRLPPSYDAFTLFPLWLYYFVQ